jgi:TatD DNase family protein
MLIDTHCHLDYFDAPQDIIKSSLDRNGQANKTSHLITISTKISQFNKILDIAKSDDRIFCSLGNHPCNVHEEEPLDVAKASQLCVKYKSKIVAIGETGLDYYHDITHKSMQQEEFLKHIELASIFNLAIVVHVRDAWGDALDIIRQSLNKNSNLRFVIHCFTGTKKEAVILNELGCYISISGIVTFKSSLELKDAVKYINPQRLLVETDSPFLAPHPHRGKQNMPEFVSYVLDEVCSLSGVSKNQIFENSKQAFLLPIN